MGDVDELNCVIGVLLCETLAPGVHATLLSVQHDLFDLGGELSIPGSSLVPDAAVKRLELAIDHRNEDLAPLKEFILPGGSRAAALCHLARAVCRRAERAIVELSEGESTSGPGLAYVNRLSDLLFVLARTLACADGGEEILWDRSRLASDSD